MKCVPHNAHRATRSLEALRYDVSFKLLKDWQNMRCLGEINGRQDAERFVAHLLTNDVSTHIEMSGDAALDCWEVWVRDEDRLNYAVSELAQFHSDPSDARYGEAIAKATQILQDQEAKRQQAVKNIRRVQPTVQPGMTGGGRIPPLTLTLLIVCVLLGFLTNFGTPKPTDTTARRIMDKLSFVQYETYDKNKGNAAESILGGEVWRAFTPAILHGDTLHLAMNMFGLVIFGRVLERLLGTPKFAAFVLILVLLPNLLQGLMPVALHGNPLFVGFSGVIYGFLGYIWVRSNLNPGFGISIPMPLMVLAIGSIVVGLSGVIEGWAYADLAHLGGLLVGCAVGYISENARRTS